ncbi:hypothetical protein QQ045_015038 [Rhodiola kirilowii]
MAELQQAWNASNDQNDESAKIINWMILEGEDRVACSPSSSSSSSDLNNDDADDVRNNGSCSSSNGPLYELSDLLLQLPIKRGLSKYYQGKSQSFRNLRKVENINDFAKKMSRKKTVPLLENSNLPPGHVKKEKVRKNLDQWSMAAGL